MNSVTSDNAYSRSQNRGPCRPQGHIKMSRGRCSFRESDVRRAVRAIEATGKEVCAVEISAEGKIRIVVGKPNPQQSVGGNEWDEVLANA